MYDKIPACRKNVHRYNLYQPQGKRNKGKSSYGQWYSRDTVHFRKFKQISSNKFFRQISTGRVNLYVYDSAPVNGGGGPGYYHYNSAGGYYYGGTTFGSTMYSGQTKSIYVLLGENLAEPIKIKGNNYKRRITEYFGLDDALVKKYLGYGISGIEAFVNEHNSAK